MDNSQNITRPRLKKTSIFGQTRRSETREPFGKGATDGGLPTGMSHLGGVGRSAPGRQYWGARFRGDVSGLAKGRGGGWLLRHGALQPSARFPLAPASGAKRETFAQLPINRLVLIKGIRQPAGTDQLGDEMGGP